MSQQKTHDLPAGKGIEPCTLSLSDLKNAPVPKVKSDQLMIDKYHDLLRPHYNLFVACLCIFLPQDTTYP